MLNMKQAMIIREAVTLICVHQFQSNSEEEKEEQTISQVTENLGVTGQEATENDRCFVKDKFVVDQIPSIETS